MLKRSIAALKYLAGKDVVGRNLRTFPDDTFIVSYPKSGNTWSRFLVANLLHPQEPLTLEGADRLVPSVDGQSRKYFAAMPRPRVIKSHWTFDPSYKRAVYVVRDPRDVVVSQYYYQIKRKVLSDGHPMEEFVGRFLAGETCPYGSWGENVASWLAARYGSPDFLLVRYEDMVTQTPVELSRIATFLGIQPEHGRIAAAVENSSADRMRQLEKVEGHKWKSTKDTRADISFVRTGTSGGWKANLPADSVAQIEAAWSPLLRWLEYETSADSKASPGTAVLEALLPQRVTR